MSGMRSESTVNGVRCNFGDTLQNMFISNRFQTVRGYSQNMMEWEEKTGVAYIFHTFFFSRTRSTEAPNHNLWKETTVRESMHHLKKKKSLTSRVATTRHHKHIG